MKKKFDYRHIICVIITLGFLAVSVFVFPGAFGRIIESFRDFGLSIAYYFCEIFGIKHNITPTVVNLPSLKIIPSGSTSVLPDTWEGFKSNWARYWKLWASKSNFFGYLGFVGDTLYYIAYGLVFILPFILLFIWLFRRYLKKENNDYNKDSKPLKAFKCFTAHTYQPVKLWLTDFICFVKENSAYWKVWLCIWLFNFNAFTIIIEFFAYYFYFVVSFDVLSIYRQVYKLFIDLFTVFHFIPLWAWVIIGVIILEAISRQIAYNTLYHRERCNRGFINERGVVTFVVGVMGAGKTMQITDMALSSEVQFRDSAFEIILETDMKFPYFPWINFENAIKQAIEHREVYDLPSCRLWVRRACSAFSNAPYRENIYGYDFERYGLFYDDKLKLMDIWQALEDYACAYFIYTVQSSLLLSNYSIRSDMLFSDLGNFPLWNGDFFKRDSKLMDSYSRHAHILDFDMLRLGCKMIEDNPNGNAFGFGVYVISEIDKERKNTPELKEVKATADECNQKNDLFNVLLKMSRHACVVANRVFVKIYADLQRPDSLGVDCRELGEVVEIKLKGDRTLALPFFAPFHIFNVVFGWLYGKFENFYVQYRFNRGDNTLFLYLVKSLTAKLQHYCERTANVFGSQVLRLEVENGSREGDVKQCKYFRQRKKILSKRYSTDCLSGIFAERAKANKVGLDDLQEYANIMATDEELRLQNSHFQTELNKLNKVKEVT
ncbi:MAG: hypothetical protein ACI4MS_06435 [Candidatus Coproplasma sp.]